MNTDWLTTCLAFVKLHEGCRLAAYPDPATGADPWTIGYGATGPDIGPGAEWTQEQADADLADRLQAINRTITQAVRVRITADQRAAMVSLTYNIGTDAFLNSTLLRLLNDGDYAGAQAQFARWNKAAGRVVLGLLNRRKDEAALFGDETV